MAAPDPMASFGGEGFDNEQFEAIKKCQDTEIYQTVDDQEKCMVDSTDLTESQVLMIKKTLPWGLFLVIAIAVGGLIYWKYYYKTAPAAPTMQMMMPQQVQESQPVFMMTPPDQQASMW